MRAASRPGASVRQRAMPVGSSILWKPLRDSHYVLASIQPDHGGLREIFIVQSVLDRIHRQARRPSGAQLLGLLLGGRYDCPITGTRYLLIEAAEEIAETTLDAKARTAALAARVAEHASDRSVECVGWYGSRNAPEPDLSSAQVAVHAQLFAEPWPTALILAGGGDTGAFFLHDKRASRWFQAPFYEVSRVDRNDHAAKTTCIAWPAYLTTETVVPLPASEREQSPSQAGERAPRPEPGPPRRSALSTMAQAIGSSAGAARRLGSAVRTSITGRAEARVRKTAELAEKARVAEAERKEQARTAHAERLERARIAAAEQAERDRLAAEQAERERLSAERERIERERAKWERAERDRAEREKLAREKAERQRAERGRLAAERAAQARFAAPQIELARRSEPVAAAPIMAREVPAKPAPQVAQPDSPARAVAVEPPRPTTNRRHTPPRVADDGEDTTASDQPYRYLALARREGFQVSENLERTGADGAETVWLLNEADFGLQITLVTSDIAVVDATLHYNIRIKDDAVWRATRPEHRHVDSQTIYVRESCVEALRAHCRRLRATGALQRDWKVTPHIYPPGTAAQ
jgi:hypothetical protein